MLEKKKPTLLSVAIAIVLFCSLCGNLIQYINATPKTKSCFLQVQFPESCRQKWRKMHLHFGENCRLPVRLLGSTADILLS